MKALISVIIPVYNVEKYLRECLDSVLAQTYANLEIILVDDGSSDGCGAICDDYAKKDNRIRVIHKQNAGVSAARNDGIDAAKGEYVCFIDSDDWVESNYVDVLYRLLAESNADISCCDKMLDFVNMSVAPVNSRAETVCYSASEAVIPFLSYNPSACLKLYSRNLMSRVRFDTTMTYGEDTKFITQMLKYVNIVAMSSAAPYHYRQRESGAVRSISNNVELIASRLRFFEYLDELTAVFPNAKDDVVFKKCSTISHIIHTTYNDPAMIEVYRKYIPYVRKNFRIFIRPQSLRGRISSVILVTSYALSKAANRLHKSYDKRISFE
jgi:glycosyltransferase involved in cell wall biosynthesis